MRETGILHQWVYVISPVKDQLIFASFCKACRMYFTEPVPYRKYSDNLEYKYMISESHLPQFGCLMPNDLTSEPMT